MPHPKLHSQRPTYNAVHPSQSQILYGIRAQRETLSQDFVHRIDMLMLRKEKLDLVAKVAEVGELSPTLRQYVAKVSEGLQGAARADGELLARRAGGGVEHGRQCCLLPRPH